MDPDERARNGLWLSVIPIIAVGFMLLLRPG